jgi:hypothetical protein
LNKLKNVSQKINAEETNSFTVDNNAVYLEVDASFAIPHPVPQTYLDEQATFENFLNKLSQNAMPNTENYQKVISRHVCYNGKIPIQSCVVEVDF